MTLAPATVDAACYCRRCVSRTTDMYAVNGRCNNCGMRFIVSNRKGDVTPLSVECPQCEVRVYGWRT